MADAIASFRFSSNPLAQLLVELVQNQSEGKSLSLPFPLDPGHTTNKTKSEEPSETESHSTGNEFAKDEVVDRADAKRCMEEGNAMSALCCLPPSIQAF